MPRGRKRKDPADAPVDGDYRRDTVLNKDPGKRYALASVDDIPVMRGRGFVRTERTEDGSGAIPAYDSGQGDGGYQVGGQLTLMEAPEERAVAVQKRGEREFAQSMQGLRAGLAETKHYGPGGRYGSLGPQPGQAPQYRVET